MDAAAALGAAVTRGRLVAAALVAALGPASAAAQARYALIVTGASGGAAYAAQYAAWRTALADKLVRVFGFSPEHVLVLAEHPGPGEGPATREGVRQAAARLERLLGPGDLLLAVLIGHGTDDGADAKFNLVGPDLDASEWADLLGRLPARLVVVNTTEASAPFLAALAGPRRVVIAATDSPAQRFSTVFPEYFVSALDDPAADVDKNGRVSVWETFMLASARVRRHYEARGQLATERALIDDTGDGVGKEAGAPGPDGPLAARVYLDAQPAPPAADPELLELFRRRAELEAEVEALKTRKPLMLDSDYLREFERLMIELARVSRAIRRRT